MDMHEEKQSHIHHDVPGGVPIKMWTHGVPVEERWPHLFEHDFLIDKWSWSVQAAC